VYYFLKFLLRPALRLFYAQTAVEGRQHVPEEGPLVVVANHPNTLLDPLLVGMLWRRQLHFLTSSRFFRSIGGWVLRASGAIPLFRQEDYKADADKTAPEKLTHAQRLARNDSSLRATHELLGAGGALLIFPEGTSFPTRRLRPLKSGVARIALGAEARHDWQLGVRILPVGLNYSAAWQFRSRLLLRVGEPIRVADYQASYEANPPATVRTLMDAIRRALEQQLAVTGSEKDEKLLEALHAVAAPCPQGLSGSRPDAAQEFRHLRALNEMMSWLTGHEPARAAALRRRVHAFRNALRRLGLAPGVPLDLPGPGWWKAIGQLLGLLAGSPLWLWGMANHYAASLLPVLLGRRVNKEEEFVAPIMLGVGMLTFPLLYCGQTWLVWHITRSGALALAYLASLPATGLFAVAFGRWVAVQRGHWRVHWLRRHRESLLRGLLEERAALLAELERFQTEWQGRVMAAAPEPKTTGE